LKDRKRRENVEECHDFSGFCGNYVTIQHVRRDIWFSNVNRREAHRMNCRRGETPRLQLFGTLRGICFALTGRHVLNSYLFSILAADLFACQARSRFWKTDSSPWREGAGQHASHSVRFLPESRKHGHYSMRTIARSPLPWRSGTARTALCIGRGRRGREIWRKNDTESADMKQEVWVVPVLRRCAMQTVGVVCDTRTGQ